MYTRPIQIRAEVHSLAKEAALHLGMPLRELIEAATLRFLEEVKEEVAEKREQFAIRSEAKERELRELQEQQGQERQEALKKAAEKRDAGLQTFKKTFKKIKGEDPTEEQLRTSKAMRDYEEMLRKM